MRAVQFASYGHTEVLDVVETGQPEIHSGQVLVEVYAASINPVDYKVREGYMKDSVPLSLPITIEGDFSGVVKKIADDVYNFKPGDLVYGQAAVLNGGSGSCAEFTAANIVSITNKPAECDFVEAAALPLAGSSAVQAIEDFLHLKKDQQILIHGGAGGIGSFAIQIAKNAGAYVATTASGKDMHFVKELGADEVIDYRTTEFDNVLKNYDAVLDTVGGETTIRSFNVLRKGGMMVSMLGWPDKSLAQKHGVIVIGQRTVVDAGHLNRLAELINQKKLKVYIDSIFPMDQAREAFRHAEEEHIRGKVVVKIK